MQRTTLSLPEDLSDALKREARRRRSSVSAVAREALSDHFGIGGGPRDVPFAALGRSIDDRSAREAEEMLDEVLDEAERDAFGDRDR